MVLKNLWVLPVLATIWIPTTFLISYGVAVYYGHVSMFLPFISDTGTLPPESCIFGQMLNIGALLLGLCAYLRHRQIVEFYHHGLQRQSSNWRHISLIFLWVGFISAFGTSMVANFQETSFMSLHIVGAMMAFIMGVIYGWGQTIFSYAMQPRMHGAWLCHLRLLLSLLATFFFVGIFSSGYVDDTTALAKENMTFEEHFHWSPDEPGYFGHMVSVGCEWLMVFCFLLYFLTFAAELRHAHLHPAKLRLVGDLAFRISNNNKLASQASECNYSIDTEQTNASSPSPKQILVKPFDFKETDTVP